MALAEITFVSAMAAGALSFLSPCVLPLVPPYLCYMAGISIDDYHQPNIQVAGVVEQKSARRSVMLASFFFTLGFSTVFIALGIGASTIGMILRQNLDLLSMLGGGIIIVMGLNFLGLVRLPWLSRDLRFQSGGKPATLSGAYVMGLAFAFGWTPCIGPILGAILGIAASGDTVGEGAWLLAIYSMGLAVPFWFAAAFSNVFMRFVSRFRRHLGLVEKAMGAFLVLTGLAFIFGYITEASIWFQQSFPILMQIG